MTAKEVCEAWIRATRPDVTDPAEIDRLARAFFDAHPTGELTHVWIARQVLREENSKGTTT